VRGRPTPDAGVRARGAAQRLRARPGREMVAAVAGPDKLVLVTFANHHFGDFARNWVSHVRRLGLGNYLVGAMDDRLLQVAPTPRALPTPRGVKPPASWHACLSMLGWTGAALVVDTPAAGLAPPPSHRR